jgi:hypothetical protein
LPEEAAVADLDQELRDCLRWHACDAEVAPGLAAGVRERSTQLARRAHATVVLALVPAAAGIAFGSVAVADASSSSDASARVQSTAMASSGPAPAPAPRPEAAPASGCSRGAWPDLTRLGRDTQIAEKPIGLPTFIRRYEHQNPHGVAVAVTTRKAVVDGHRLSAGSYAIEIVTPEPRQVIWKLMIGTTPRSDRHYHRSTVYNASRHGCIAVREETTPAPRPSQQA